MKKTKLKQETSGIGAIPERDNLAEFFGRRSFMERVGPVLAEMGRLLCAGEAVAPDTQLPEYCHHILGIFRRTYFKNFPSFGETVQLDQEHLFTDPSEAKPGVTIDWRRLGRMIGIGLRCLRFNQCEVREELESLPELESRPDEEFLERFLGVQREETERGPSLVELLETPGCAEPVSESLPVWSEAAFQWGSDALAELNAGVVEGMKGFLDETGQFAGQSNRANIYWFLLLAWPEIEQMQQSRPPKTRNDFARWLEPFAQAGIVSVGDLDQLCDICDDIGLRFKGRGAPQK